MVACRWSKIMSADPQAALDNEESAERLARLVDAVIAETAALEAVKTLALQLRRAKAAHKHAREKLRDLSFIERQRRNGRGK